jgi:hypothetical protein
MKEEVAQYECRIMSIIGFEMYRITSIIQKNNETTKIILWDV